MPSPFNLPQATRSVSVPLFVVLAMLASTAVLFAAAFVDTDDGFVDPSWQDTPFVTDPAGDSSEGADTDVISTWLQNDSNDFYFGIQLADKPALGERYRATVASIDCDNDGIFEEPNDRIVSYIASEDMVFVLHGDQSYIYLTDPDDGEVVFPDDDDFVEWMAEIDIIETNWDPGFNPKYNCSLPDDINIQFGTADTTTLFPPPGYAIPLDITDAYGWSVSEGKALPRPTTLVAEKNGNDLLFTWEHTGQNESYQVYHNDSPYFMPGDAGVSAVNAPIDGSPWQTSDAGVVGTPASSYYYTVVGQVDLDEATLRESDPSNEMGLFEFIIMPGAS